METTHKKQAITTLTRPDVQVQVNNLASGKAKLAVMKLFLESVWCSDNPGNHFR